MNSGPGKGKEKTLVDLATFIPALLAPKPSSGNGAAVAVAPWDLSWMKDDKDQKGEATVKEKLKVCCNRPVVGCGDSCVVVPCVSPARWRVATGLLPPQTA